MRRTVYILLAILLCAALIVSCDADKAGDSTPQPGPSANMTDYYATGRQKLIDWNLITLPEIEGLGSEDFTIEEGIGWWTSDADICFDFDSGVTEDAYNAIKACIESLCGTTQTDGNPKIDYDIGNPEQIVQIDNWWAYDGKRYNLCFNIENEGLYFNIIQSN